MEKIRIEFSQWELRHIISALTEKINDLTEEISESPKKGTITEVTQLYRDNLSEIKDKLQQTIAGKEEEHQ